jgi:NADPH:quinone reductase-like Zn-dependent oxidoreductase
LALTYHSFGPPAEVLKLEEVDATGNRRLEEGQVLVQLVASTVHPSDMGMIAGTYGDLPKLPAVGGREGIGIVVDSCESSKDMIGALVKFPPGAWRNFAVAREEDLFLVPKDIDTYQAAMAFINPLTASMLLTSVRRLHMRSWVIQNAANSAVGVAVIQIAKYLDLHTINLVRNCESRREKLESYGATIVCDSETFDPKAVPDYTEGKFPLLGLNSIGGNSAMNIIKSMAYGGDVITFGGMVGDKVRFPTRELIFSGLKLHGFWLDKWVKDQSHGKMQAVYDSVFALLRERIVHIPVAGTVKLSDGAEALLDAYNNRSDGKILVVP